MAKENSLKYTRREFFDTVKSGFLGYVAGSLYERYRQTEKYAENLKKEFKKYAKKTGNELAELDKRIDNLPDYHPKKIAKNAEDWRSNLWRKVLGKTKEDQKQFRNKIGIKSKTSLKKPYQQPQPKQIVSRRGFLSSDYWKGLASDYLDKHAAETGAVVGATYTLKKGRDKRKKEYEKVQQVEKLKTANKELENRVSQLEETVKKSTPEIMMVIGVLGLIVSIVLSSFSITGFVISSKYFNNSLNFAIAVVSIVLMFLGLKIK